VTARFIADLSTTVWLPAAFASSSMAMRFLSMGRLVENVTPEELPVRLRLKEDMTANLCTKNRFGYRQIRYIKNARGTEKE